MRFAGNSGVDVYPVGLLADLQRDWRMVTKLRKRPIYVARRLRYLRERIARREWRAVKNTFNGYLAEPAEWPDGLTRCGSGWTRRRALSDLRRRWAR
jgi:hypothetical protein